jgi:hypothetical protein
VDGVTASGATATAKQTFTKTIDVVVEIFVPVGAAIAGFFMPAVLGGGASIGDAIYSANKSSLGNHIAWGLQALINLAVGGAFWTLRGHGNIVAKAIGGAVGGFFLGAAAGCLPGILSGATPPTGLIDQLASGIQEVAQ